MAPETVLTELRLRAGADGAPKKRSGPEILAQAKLEQNLLIEWARERGLVFPCEETLSRIQDTHGEHHVYHDTERGRIFKITHGVDRKNPGFALTVDTKPHVGKKSQRYLSEPYMREATPFEYLARLRLFNLTFRDSNVFEGVIDEPGKEAIVISQPFINGSAASDEEVAALMAQRGFQSVPGVTAGRPESVSYFRQSDQVAVFDTHGQNYLVSGEGVVPIDALIIYASDYLADYLKLSEEERDEELGL